MAVGSSKFCLYVIIFFFTIFQKQTTTASSLDLDNSRVITLFKLNPMTKVKKLLEIYGKFGPIVKCTKHGGTKATIVFEDAAAVQQVLKLGYVQVSSHTLHYFVCVTCCHVG